MLINQSQKDFELPDSGTFTGVVADVVDLGEKVHPVYGTKKRIRIVWVLDKNDSEGRPFRVMVSANATVADKPKESTLYTVAKKVLGTVPTIPFETETLIGRSNKLFVEREQDPKTGKWYANVKAILPLDGAPALAIPTNFVRDQDKPKTPAGTVAPQNVTTGTPAPAVEQQADVAF